MRVNVVLFYHSWEGQAARAVCFFIIKFMNGRDVWGHPDSIYV
ncbi:hypothetical protein SAMN03159341_10136 [Paenibacillus sp. 1_12]|nr:hypothetical protein SAMN03159341_10136 [Paenibacillus sp. 1_12]